MTDAEPLFRPLPRQIRHSFARLSDKGGLNWKDNRPSPRELIAVAWIQCQNAGGRCWGSALGEWQLRSPMSVRRCYLVELLSRPKERKCIDCVSLCKRRWTMSCWYVVLWWQSDLTYRNVLRLSQIPRSPSHVLVSSGFSLQMSLAFDISKHTQPHSVFFLSQ